MDRLSPLYHISIEYKAPHGFNGFPEQRLIRSSAPFSTWFTSDGRFVVKLFQRWLSSSISQVDVEKPGRFQDQDNSGMQQSGDALMKSSSSATGTGTSSNRVRKRG